MVHNKLTIGALIVILIASSVSACAPDASGSPGTNMTGAQAIAQALPIPTWQQVNTNGFGDPRELEVSSLEAFNGYLYAGTYNLIEPLVTFDGARIFRSPDGVTWTPVTQPGFQDPHDSAPPAILDFVIFGNRLYASTGRSGNAAQIWRSSNGVNWGPMVAAGFGDPDIHDIAALAVYNNVIYAGASSQVSGARIFRSTSGDSNTWSPIAPAAPTMPGASVTEFGILNGALYAMIESEAPLQIWRTTGGPWTTVMNNGFGDSLTTSSGGMAVFGGYVYIGAGNSAVGAQLWRSNNGVSWAQAINPGFGDPNNQKVETVLVFQNQLYVSVKNTVTGMEVWRSADGTLWEQVNPDGFGDSNNTGTNRGHATADFMSQLYVGTSNVVTGGELWRMLQPLPDTRTPTPTETPTSTSTDTPTFTPTDTLTPTFTDTFTPTATDTPTPTSTDTLTPTSTDTPTPSMETPTPTDTPSPTLTSTLTPVSNTPGKITGGGNIDTGNTKATLGFVVSFREGDPAPGGNLTYQDHGIGLHLKATSFDLLVIDGSHARFTGMAMMNDVQEVNFEVEVYDLSDLGLPDVFMLSIPAMNYYITAGILTGGNITIHK